MIKKLIKIVLISILYFFQTQLSTFSQTNDEQFNYFFQNFMIAIESRNISKITDLTNFPFISEDIGLSQDKETSISIGSFKINPIIPEYRVLSKAKFNTETIFKNIEYEETVKLILIDGYFIIDYYMMDKDIELEHNQYFFFKVDGEYKYIKCISYFS